jgi:N4-gp56 family major capsid protein
MADMNVTAARPLLTATIWDSEFFTEYVRKSQFSRYFGTKMESMIQIKEDLTAKKGDSIVFPAVRRLVGAGVTGNTVLEGNEEVLNARSMKLSVGVIRHAVAVSDWDDQKSVIELRDAAREALMTWELEKMRNDIISSLGSITADGSVQLTYGAATAGQRNTHLTNNADRTLFGALVANGVSNVFATALLTLDNTADKFSTGMISMAKRRAKAANPRLRPITVNGDEEWWVIFCNSAQYRDLQADPVMIASLQQGWVRGADNPLFTAGDLIWSGTIIREIPELTTVTGAGAGGIDVAPAFMCGAQALGIGWAQRAKSTTNTRDYGFMHGTGIQEMRGIGKLRFGTDVTTDDAKPIDQGVFTMWTASIGDA